MMLDAEQVKQEYETGDWERMVEALPFTVDGEAVEAASSSLYAARQLMQRPWAWEKCPRCGGHTWDIFGASYETYGRCVGCGHVKCIHSG